jgi:hypothetical protein
METLVLSKNSLLAGVALVAVALSIAVVPGPVQAEILLQTNSGLWVNGNQFAYGFKTMPGIVMAPDVRGNSGFMAQRAQGWYSYRRGDSSTGFMLVDPAGSGTLSASSPRQAVVRSHKAFRSSSISVWPLHASGIIIIIACASG